MDDPTREQNRRSFAWGLVGWLNFIALVLVAFIVAHAAGYVGSVSGWWILGGGVLTVGVFVMMIWGLIKS